MSQEICFRGGGDWRKKNDGNQLIEVHKFW